MAKFNNECPICLNRELDYDALEPVDETIQQEVHCRSCNTDFKICASPEWYVLLDEEDVSTISLFPIKLRYNATDQYIIELESYKNPIVVPTVFENRITEELLSDAKYDDVVNRGKTVELNSAIFVIILNRILNKR